MVHHYITMTGIDIRTDIDALPQCVEYGVLYSANPNGRNRYPARNEIPDILSNMADFSTALHVCGSQAKNQLINHRLDDLTCKVQRIQVNGVVTPDELRTICSVYPDNAIITQHNICNASLVSIEVLSLNHSLLVDNSGGRGVLPDKWERPDTWKKVGFAGGIGPSNICSVWNSVELVAKGEWWIDMETSLRDDDDWFSITKAQQVLKTLFDHHNPPSRIFLSPKFT